MNLILEASWYLDVTVANQAWSYFWWTTKCNRFFHGLRGSCRDGRDSGNECDRGVFFWSSKVLAGADICVAVSTRYITMYISVAAGFRHCLGEERWRSELWCGMQGLVTTAFAMSQSIRVDWWAPWDTLRLEVDARKMFGRILVACVGGKRKWENISEHCNGQPETEDFKVTESVSWGQPWKSSMSCWPSPATLVLAP